MGKRSTTGPELVRSTSERVDLNRDASSHGLESVEEFEMRDHIFLKVYRALRDTREGGCSRVPVGFAAKVIRWPRSILCFHAPEVHPTSDLSGGLGQAYC